MIEVLLVEDDESNRKLLVEILESAGHRVCAASSGRAAITLAMERCPDVIVMDVNLPDLDGLAATRLLRAQPATRAIPVLAVTGLAMRGDAERIRAAGCDGYLGKPISYRDLLAAVAALAAGRPMPDLGRRRR